MVNYKEQMSAYTKGGMNAKCSPSTDYHVALQPGTQIKLWSSWKTHKHNERERICQKVITICPAVSYYVFSAPNDK